MRVWLVSVFLFLAPGVALAQSLVAEASMWAYEQGDFEEAATLADGSSDADAYGIAARAILAEIIVENTDPDPDVLDRAEAFARKALELDPKHVEARLQLAISLSMRTRNMSKIQAWQSGHGQTARKLAEEVIADDPGNLYADGFLSVWHTEAVRIGGRFGASFVGAKVKAGKAHYARAHELNPDDVGLHWQYARSLTLLNAKKHRRDIDEALNRAINANQDNAVERVFYQRALELKSALANGQLEAALELAASLL